MLPLGELATGASGGVLRSQLGEVRVGIEELGFAALDLSNPGADLRIPLGAELDGVQAVAQRANQLFPLLLGQSKRLFQYLFSGGCHPQSLSHSAVDGQINSAKAVSSLVSGRAASRQGVSVDYATPQFSGSTLSGGVNRIGRAWLGLHQQQRPVR